MSTKLTVTLDDSLARRAKAYARKKRTTVSKVLAEYLASLDYAETAKFDKSELPPITRSLVGIAKGADVTEDDYIAYLEKKYR
jgi:predicted transcriptional regulator